MCIPKRHSVRNAEITSLASASTSAGPRAWMSMQMERRDPRLEVTDWRNTIPQGHRDVTSEPCQSVGHSLNRLVHVLKRRRKTEAEAHPVAAMVGMNIGSGECCFDGARM